MRRKNLTSRKSLFDIPQSTEPKKRGRPKKTVTELEIPVEKKKRGRPKKIVESVPTQAQTEKKRGRPKKVQETKPVKVDSSWKDFLNGEKPELLKPLEFYVDTGDGKQDIFRGYRQDSCGTVTDEPFKMYVLRKRYGNLYYREIPGCNTIENCPNNFPDCELCGRNKK
jgi:hypothetical protein